MNWNEYNNSILGNRHLGIQLHFTIFTTKIMIDYVCSNHRSELLRYYCSTPKGIVRKIQMCFSFQLAEDPSVIQLIETRVVCYNKPIQSNLLYN